MTKIKNKKLRGQVWSFGKIREQNIYHILNISGPSERPQDLTGDREYVGFVGHRNVWLDIDNGTHSNLQIAQTDSMIWSRTNRSDGRSTDLDGESTENIKQNKQKHNEKIMRKKKENQGAKNE